MRYGNIENTNSLKVNSEAVKPDKIDMNTMLNAFRIAVNGSLTQFSMVDGIIDEYEDESGIFELTTPFAHYKMNDNAGNTTVVDDGTGANNGTAQQNTSSLTTTGRINEALDFNGSSDYIDLTSTLLPDIRTDTTGTIALWVNLNNFNDAWQFWYIGDGSGVVERFQFRIVSGTGVVLCQGADNTGTTQWQFTSDNPLTTGTWYHIVLVQDGISPLLYINGAVTPITFSTTTDTTFWYGDEGTNLVDMFIGASKFNNTIQQFIDGKIDDVRYYQNKALTSDEVVLLYNSGTGTEASSFGSSNISYDSVNDLYSPTSQFPNSEATVGTNTVLLINFNGSDAQTSYTAETGQTVTFVGNAQLDTSDKKFGTASLELDGATDYISIPDSADWSFGTGDFTIDFWVNFIDNTGNQGVILQTVDANNQWYLFKHASGDKLNFFYKVGGVTVADYIATNAMTFTVGEWTHVAFVRDGSGAKLFIDGVEVALTETTAFGNLTDIGSAPLWVGRPADANDGLWARVDDFRITKGEALWTSNFDGVLNMTLVSKDFVAEAQPDTARIILFEEDIDALTLNTDLFAYVSRDGGTTFTQATLVDEGNYDTTSRILSASVDISGQPSGTDMQYKITTANNKDLNIHGSSLTWD